MKHGRLLFAVVAISACTTAPKVPPTDPVTQTVAAPSSSVPAANEPPKACLPPGTRDGELVHVYAKGSKVVACYADPEADVTADPSHPCIAFDPVTGAPERAESFREPSESAYGESSEKFSVERSTSTLKVCPRTSKPSCSTIRLTGSAAKLPKVPDEWNPDHENKTAFVDEQGERVFILVPEQAGEIFTVYGETYDVKRRSRISRVKLSREDLTVPDSDPAATVRIFGDSSNLWSGYWVGNRVVLEDTVCCGPSGSTLLLDPIKGDMIRLHGFQGRFDRDPAGQWVALEGKSLAHVDVTNLKRTRFAVAPGELLTSDKRSANWVSVPAGMALIHANPPGYQLIGPETRTAGETRVGESRTRTGVQVRSLPLCDRPRESPKN